MNVIKEAGFDKVQPILGHGTGIMSAEPPIVVSWDTREIKEAMVFNLEPSIYLPNVGRARIEGVFLVTEEGAERLTKLNQDLFIL